MYKLFGIIKGLLISNDVDQTKQLILQTSTSATTGTTTTITAAQTSNQTLNIPDTGATDTLTTNAASQTLTNKTIDATSNTLSNIADANIKADAAIALNKLATQTASRALVTDSGGVIIPSSTTATELSYVHGVTSNIQTQLNSAAINPMTTLGDTLYEDATPAPARLAGNTTTTKKYLTQTGTGSASAAPAWNTVDAADITSGTLPITRGGTSQTTASAAFNALSPMTTMGDIIVGGTSGTNARLGVGIDGSILTSDSTATNGVSWQNPINNKNQLINGAFDYWQAGTSITIANTATSWLADQWLCKNSVGSGGVVTYSQVAGSNNGSIHGASIQISTAPGTPSSSPFYLIQTLSNKTSISLYNQTVSFSVKIKALGNINQVLLAVSYNTSETQILTGSVLSSTTVTVNSSGWTTCTLNNVSIGTTPTTSGVVGIFIKPQGVSSGHITDLNNGFLVEQAILNLGPVAMPFQRQFINPINELQSCQYFYEKSYDPDTAPATATTTNAVDIIGTTGLTYTSIPYKVVKRAAPSIIFYSPNNGASGNIYNVSTSANTSAINTSNTGTSSTSLSWTVPSNGQHFTFHWTADARL